MTLYTAQVNVPGYLPMSDDQPAFFTSAQEAWRYLADEVERDADADDDKRDYEYTARMIKESASEDVPIIGAWLAIDSSDPYDLGVAYGVDVYDGPCQYGEAVNLYRNTTHGPVPAVTLIEADSYGMLPACQLCADTYESLSGKRQLTPEKRSEAFSGSEHYAAGRMGHRYITNAKLNQVQSEVMHDAIMAAFQAGYLAAAEGTSVDELLSRMAELD